MTTQDPSNNQGLPEPFEPGLLYFPDDISPAEAWEAMLALAVEGFPYVKSHAIVATGVIWGLWMGMCLMELNPAFGAECIIAGNRMETPHFERSKTMLEARFGDESPDVVLNDDTAADAIAELERIFKKDGRDA